MRTWKMITAVALVMAVTGTAWAVTVPGLPNGYTYLKSRNEDMGSTYVVSGLVAGDTFTYDVSALVDDGASHPIVGVLNGIPGQVRNVRKFGAPGAVVAPDSGGRLEDSWGIALLYHINGGHLNNPLTPGSIVGSNGGSPIYDNSAGAEGTWLTIMFHSGVDTQVITTAGNGVNGVPAGMQKQQTTTIGLMAEIYAVDASLMVPTGVAPGTKDAVNLIDAGARVDIDTYTGWTGDTLAGSVKLIQGTSDYFQSSVVVNSSGVIVSNALDATTAYFDIDATNTAWLWNPLWGQKPGQPSELADPLATFPAPGYNTNIWFQWTLDNGQRGWDVHSDDIGGAFTNAVPEPVTILGVILGVGSLGGYIRRRFHA